MRSDFPLAAERYSASIILRTVHPCSGVTMGHRSSRMHLTKCSTGFSVLIASGLTCSQSPPCLRVTMNGCAVAPIFVPRTRSRCVGSWTTDAHAFSKRSEAPFSKRIIPVAKSSTFELFADEFSSKLVVRLPHGFHRLRAAHEIPLLVNKVHPVVQQRASAGFGFLVEPSAHAGGDAPRLTEVRGTSNTLRPVLRIPGASGYMLTPA